MARVWCNCYRRALRQLLLLEQLWQAIPRHEVMVTNENGERHLKVWKLLNQRLPGPCRKARRQFAYHGYAYFAAAFSQAGLLHHSFPSVHLFLITQVCPVIHPILHDFVTSFLSANLKEKYRWHILVHHLSWDFHHHFPFSSWLSLHDISYRFLVLRWFRYSARRQKDQLAHAIRIAKTELGWKVRTETMGYDNKLFVRVLATHPCFNGMDEELNAVSWGPQLEGRPPGRTHTQQINRCNSELVSQQVYHSVEIQPRSPEAMDE